MSQTQRVDFEANDKGATEKIKNFRRETQDLSRGLMEDARNMGLSSKEFTKYYEDETKAIERRAKITQSEGLAHARESRDLGLKSAGNAIERGVVQDRYSKQVAGVKENFEDEKRQTSLLREIAETLKKSAKEESTDRTIRESRGMDLKSLSSTEAYRQSILQEQAETMEDGGDRGGRRSMVGMAKMVAGVVGIGMAANIAKGAYTKLFEAESGERYDIEVLSSLPFGGLFMAGQSRHYDVQKEAQETMGKLYAVTGKTYSRKNDGRNVFDFKLDKFGIDATEASNRLLEMAKIRGDVPSVTDMGGMVAMRAAYDLNPQKLMSLYGIGKYSDNPNAIRSMMAFLDQESGDNPAMLNLEMDAITTLTQSAAQKYGVGNMERWAGAVKGFVGVGGAFTGDLAASRISSVQQGLQGGDEYTNALQMGILQKMYPGASFMQLKSMQEQGLETKGYFTKMAKFGMENYTGDHRAAFLQKQFNLGPTDAIQLAKSLAEDPSLYAEIEQEGSANWMERYKGIEKKGEKGTGDIISNEALIRSQFALGIKEGVLSIAEDSELFNKAMVGVEGVMEILMISFTRSMKTIAKELIEEF